LTTNSYLHFQRLERDYNSMKLLNGPLITWEVKSPMNPPESYPVKYLITYHMLAPTVEGDRSNHIIEINTSSPSYPVAVVPTMIFRTPIIKHPHVYSDGSKRVCSGGMPLSETLAFLCVRLARFFQYDPTLINIRSIASMEFYNWYIKNRKNLPLDRSPLPNLEGLKILNMTKTNQTNQSSEGKLVIKARRPG
jgi:hypothetical protein